MTDQQNQPTEFDTAFAEAINQEPVDSQPPQEPDPVSPPESAPSGPTWEERVASLEQERDQYQHKWQSDAGRISAYQRKIEELEAAVRQSQARQQDPNDEEWSAIKEDFPEIATAMERRMDRRLQDLMQRIAPIEELNKNVRIDQEYKSLAAEHPDWDRIRNLPDFNQWLTNQPDPVQKLANSDYAKDASYVLSSYKLYAGARDRHARQIQAKRQAALAANVSTPAKRQVRQEIPSDDYDRAWEAAIKSRKR